MRYLPLLLIFLLITPVFAVEKITHKEEEYTLDANSEIKDKLRVEFHKWNDEKHKKIKLKKDLTGFEVVDK